jgi:hypothetical protein
MIKVSVLYPSGKGNTFNMNYYLATPIPLVRRLSGRALKRVEVEAGMGGLMQRLGPSLSRHGASLLWIGPGVPGLL